jgi:hypothetical protein
MRALENCKPKKFVYKKRNKSADLTSNAVTQRKQQQKSTDAIIFT